MTKELFDVICVLKTYHSNSCLVTLVEISSNFKARSLVLLGDILYSVDVFIYLAITGFCLSLSFTKTTFLNFACFHG